MTSISGVDDAQALLEGIVTTSKRRTGIQLPISFVRDRSGNTPLARLLRGGQGGEVRLKLYFTLLLLAARKPYKIDRLIPNRNWAEALGLPDPDGNGKRRIADALNWLDREGFIKLDRRPGQPPIIQMLNVEDGKPWRRPSWPYVKVPLSFWSQYRLHDLSARAIAVWLVLLELTGGKGRPMTQSIGTKRSKEYGLSDETMLRGSDELVTQGIITTKFGVLGEKDFDWRRRRKLYTVIENDESDETNESDETDESDEAGEEKE